MEAAEVQKLPPTNPGDTLHPLRKRGWVMEAISRFLGESGASEPTVLFTRIS